MNWKITFTLLLTSFLGMGQEINVRVGSTNYLTTSTYNGFPNTLSGATSAATNFTIQNLGPGALNLMGVPRVEIAGPDAASFVITQPSAATIAAGANTTFTIAFAPTSIGIKTAMIVIENDDADEGSYSINLSGIATSSVSSAIIVTPSYTYPTNIAYQNYQATDINASGNDIEVGSFTLRDGSGTNDADNLPTALTDITFSLSNWTNIRSVALYDGATEVGGDEEGAATITFNGLNLTAPDNGTKVFTLRVSYKDAVTDNAVPQFIITAATASAAGSGFAYAHSGTGAAATTSARTSTSASNNRINVVATKLEFIQGPTDTDTFVAMSPSLTVQAVDVLGNLDLNYTTAVILNTTGTYNTAGGTVNDANNNAVAGIATFPAIVHSVAGSGLILTAISGSLTTDVSNPFEIGPASGASNYFRSRTSGDWNTASNWESSFNNVDNWITSTLVPTDVSRGIKILNGHTITCTTTANADQMSIDAGGALVLNTGANFTLSNGTGTDLTVSGTFTHNNGTFNRLGTISFAATGVYNHAIAASTLTLPLATWNVNSTCNITGLNNASPIVANNMNQTFGILNWNNPNQMGYVAVNNASFKVATTLNIGTTTSNTNNILCLADTGTFTNAIKTLTISGGKLIASAGTGNSTMTITGATTLSGGEFIGSQGSGTATLNTNTTFTVSGGRFILINSANSGNVNFTLSATNRDLSLTGTGALFLENVSSTAGVATLTLNRSLISSSTATPALDFGTGIVADNAINIKGSLTKSGTGTFTTSSSNPAKGFVFSNTGAQTLSYSGTDSSSINYTVSSGSILTLSTGLTFGTAAGPESVFTVQGGGRLSMGTNIITGNASSSRFIAETGSTLSSSSTGGLGGTVATGNFQNFGSVNPIPASGRLSLAAGVNYILSGITTTPFPVAGGGTFGNPATITTSANITSNMNSALTVTSAFTVSSGTFRLNTANNDLILNNAALTVTGNFDNNGENQILNGGGAPSIVINGNFITRDAQGFVGTNTAIPSITPTLGATSIVEYGLSGSQVVQGSPAYKNLNFSGNGTKTLDGNAAVSTKITVTSPAIFDTGAFTAGGTGTALTMTGTAQYRTSGAGIKPDATGTYSLVAGSIIEFYGSQPTEIRLGSPAINYGKIVVSGSDVSTNTTSTGLQFISASAGFNVKAGGVFKFKNTDGFTGSTTTALSNTPFVNPVLDANSTIEYAGASQYITPLSTVLNNGNSYKKVIISGTGTKTIPGTVEILISDNLTVASSKLQIDADRLLTVNNAVINSGGDIEILNNGNLVQIANGISNTGSIKMTRTTRVMKPYDHVLIGSPVQENVASQIPSVFAATYIWSLSGTMDGAWDNLSSTIPGQGFVARKNGTAAATHDLEYTGTPNNGTIGNLADAYNASSDVGGNYMLLSNPYPSAITASALIAANTAILSGTLYFWTALTPVSNNTYTANDYATWNGTGSVAISDISGTNDLRPTGFIAAGQGFFARIKADGMVNFTNAMRSRTASNNGQFFRPAPNENDASVINHKIWLNLTNENHAFRQMLVGYVAGATNDVEGQFDGDSYTDNAIDLYSIVEERKLVIQGRELPFINTDVVPLGYRITAAGNYTLSIDQLEGIFEQDQDIYLEDLLTHTVHDLKAAPYTFTTATGVFDDRFLLRYTNSALGNDDYTTISNNLMVLKNKQQLQIKSALENIEGIIVYDILGREVFKASHLNQNAYTIDNVVMNTQTLIVKIRLQNGMTVTRKVIF